MKLRRLLGLAMLAGGGYAAYRISGKMNELKATYNKVIAFNGEEKVYETFDGDSYAALFAGLSLDLSEAEMVGESATLKIYGEYCGIDIKVPSHWNVKVEGVEDKAGVDNSVEFDGDDSTSKLLIIDYDIKYSGLQIREVNADGFVVEEAEEDDLEEMPDPYEAVEVEEEIEMPSDI